jgi:hypothetical protein
MREGHERGLAEGREEGVAQGPHDAVLVILRRRFGEPSPALAQALAQATQPDLYEVLDLALGGTIEQISARLGL